MPPPDPLATATESLRRGDLRSARAISAAALRALPADAAATRAHALILLQAGATAEADAGFRRVLAASPDDVESLANLAVLCAGSAPLESVTLLERAVALRPEHPALRYNLGNALLRVGREAEALGCFDAVLAREPGSANAHNNRGSALKRLGRLAEARAAFARAAALDPKHATARTNLGVALADAGEWDDAIRVLDEAVALDPCNLEARGELAGVLVEAGQFERAFAEFEQALALEPHHRNLWYNLGLALLRYGDVPRAVAVFTEARQHAPGDREVLASLAQALLLAGDAAGALAQLAAARALGELPAEALAVEVAAQLQCADWSRLEEARAALRRATEAAPGDCPPLVYSMVLDEPATQRAAAARYYRFLARGVNALPRRERRPGRLRVAYLSPDFGDHPVANSIVEVLERHDRARIELLGVGLRARPASAVGERIAAACEHFENLSARSDMDVARRLAELDVDIAVDLAGHTLGSRPRILLARGARLQVSYLGYPGTWGGPAIDYLVADEVVIPAGAESDYVEHLVRLEGGFFPSDATQTLDEAPSRATAGLPESGLVFAALTRASRILPETFACWMRILGAIPGSILWLSAGGSAREALRSAAATAGIGAERLRFASRLPSRAAYLAQLSLADVFLDVFPYAGHSTVRDALYAGVPVVTLAGRSFAARVAPSLVRHAGLGEWIAQDWPDYEALACRAARDADWRSAARERLRTTRAGASSDARRLAAQLEAAYVWMLERWQRNEVAVHVRIGRDGTIVPERPSAVANL
ncbi:MAG: tetratricopeptide repeat protein [Proteobacteria bacterium]|nr:tetratricopeptide repeat protein [Pseudomonadota bacterium]